MKKTYILDTNILLRSPYSIYGFGDNDVCITEVTVEELDFKKRAEDREVGYNARVVLRLISELRKQGNLLQGVPMPNGGVFKIIGIDEDYLKELPKGWKKDKADNVMLQTVECYIAKSDKECIFITNDTNLQIKADCRDIKVQDYHNERIADDIEMYTGRCKYFVNDFELDELYQRETSNPKKITFYSIDTYKKEKPVFHENEFVLLASNENPSKTILLKYKNGRLERLQFCDKIQSITPLNVGQQFALEALLAPVEEIPLVILQGPAGTAKTFLSLAAGMEEVIENDNYKRVLICRPNSKFDDDIGYLKGGEKEKIEPLIRPFRDNLEILLEKKGTDFKDIPETMNALFDSEIIKAEAMAYMRGRSITNTYIIVDEAQNATPNQILGMITRAGKGSKIVIVGDPNQIDEVKLDKRNNGLVFASEKMKDSTLCASLTFEDRECKRSDLAKEAAKLLSL